MMNSISIRFPNTELTKFQNDPYFGEWQMKMVFAIIEDLSGVFSLKCSQMHDNF